jgi:peptidoglycan/LPS O-acetylase OafA/YrhL
LNNKLTFVEALRGYAILGVVFTHSTQKMTDLPQWLNNIGIQGARGVQLFFIVSAFTLFYSLARKYETRSIDIKDFFVRRFFRIAPAFYVAFVFYLCFLLWMNQVGLKGLTNDYTLGRVLSTLTFTGLLSPEWLYSLVPGGWSISAEMLFYLLMPLIFMLVRNVKAAILLVIVTLVISGLSTYSVLYFDIWEAGNLREKYLFYWFPNQLPVFCLGVMLFYLLKDKMNPVSWKKYDTVSHILILCSIVIIGGLAISGGVGGPYFPSHFLFGIGFVILAYGLGLREKHFLVNRVIVFIGQISFSMYLIHFFVLDIILKLFVDRLLLSFSNSIVLIIVFLSTLLVTIGLSYLSYRIIELPGIKLGRKISRRMKEKSVIEVAWKSL